ncbi:MBL fold metallo-hydrolase [Rhodopirellula halodulae]|uniref:MBL fold metallo-hydrolase n=1 Tax=Rhodopirellula halodulae TaxID=2894198 RepID=UPI001E4F16BF|nr:MBL fold metallo-hydrolase [Rhodopirellula sp. JC737]MCC9656051.1 MBL fold metallo-hydrolase [Rhodopirellula sp. JC737]
MTASESANSDSYETNPPSSDITPEVIFLGTGTSVGVPAIGCECDVCQSTDPRNNRTRCAILIRLPEGNLLIDTPPDLRTQLLREKIGLVHAVVFTHEHADHIYGLDDLRLFPFRLQRPVPLYCREEVESRIRTSYDYAFSTRTQTHAGSRPQLQIHSINNDDSFEVLGVQMTPVPLKHGPHFDVLGFRMGDFAYCTDTNHIPESSMERLRGLDTLVLDALRFTPHPTHFNIDEALEVIDQLQPRQAFLTHLGHDIDHGPVEASLPDHVHLAHDGLRLSMPSIS